MGCVVAGLVRFGWWAWILGAIFCAAWVVHAFFQLKKLDFQNLKSAEEKKRFRAFRRQDEGKLSIGPALFGAIFLMPLRSAIFLSILFYNTLMLSLVDQFVPEGKDVKDIPVARFLFKYFLAPTHYFGLLAGGVQVREHYMGSDPKKLETGCIVSNHVSMWDIPYLVDAAKCGFMAKVGIGSTPLLGGAARALGCIFVDRMDPKKRHLAKEQLLDRQKNAAGRPPLVVFPEGTTTNGVSLVPFKKGAFEALLPVTPVVLIYRCPMVHFAYDIIPGSTWSAMCFSTPCMSIIDAYWLAPTTPPKLPEGADDAKRTELAIQYTNTVRKLMSDVLARYSDPNMKDDNAKLPEEWNGTLADKCEAMRVLLDNEDMYNDYKETAKDSGRQKTA